MPDEFPLPLLVTAFLAASALYASVGHGGASAYLAVMGFAGMLPAEMKPIALTLNIAVSAMALTMFARAGHFRGQLFWPLALASIPAAFILANSLSGLGGFFVKGGVVPSLTWMLLPAVVVGGWFGATWGSGKAHSPALRQALAAVLVVAATKFLVT